MNDIIESSVESAVSGLLAALLSFAVANIGIVLLVAFVAASLFVIIALAARRKAAAQALARAARLREDTAARLHALLVSDTFKELELGLMQGETARTMQGMEQAAYTLLQQAEQLDNKLKALRLALFSMSGTLQQASELELEADDLWRRADRYLHDLSGIGQQVKGAGTHARQLESRMNAAARRIRELAAETGFPLDELRDQLQQVEAAFRQAEQRAAFDAVQAQAELAGVGRRIDALQSRTQRFQNNVAALQSMRERLDRQKPLSAAERIDPIMRRLDEALRGGQEVDLRAAASEIERMMQETGKERGIR